MRLSGRTVLITGGTSGIGLELARRLLARGNAVVVTGRDETKLAQARAALPGLHAIRSDASDPAAIDSLHDQLLAQFPALDMLINNAGIMRNIKLRDERALDDVTRELDVNLAGPIRMVQRFLPHLLAQPEAAIVNVSSGLAFVPFPPAPIYSAAKAGLHAYTQVLRVQLRGTRVAVIELAPPGTDTSLFHGEFAQEVASTKPMPLNVLADKAISALAAGKVEIRPGLSNVLKFMSRAAPAFMLNQLAKATTPRPQ